MTKKQRKYMIRNSITTILDKQDLSHDQWLTMQSCLILICYSPEMLIKINDKIGELIKEIPTPTRRKKHVKK